MKEGKRKEGRKEGQAGKRKDVATECPVTEGPGDRGPGDRVPGILGTRNTECPETECWED